MKDFCEFVFATKPDMKGNKGRVYLPEILFHTFLILSRILNKVRVRFCVCSCFIVSCILHFPQLPFFHLCNVHNALSKSTMILHGCNLLTNGEHQKQIKLQGSMEHAYVNELKEDMQLYVFTSPFILILFRMQCVCFIKRCKV